VWQFLAHSQVWLEGGWVGWVGLWGCYIGLGILVTQVCGMLDCGSRGNDPSAGSPTER